MPELGIEVRGGLHTGECELRGDDIGGIAVHIGARVAALAAAGEVLVSSTVKELVNGSGIVFQDRGTHVLKGVPGQWQLFAPVGEHDLSEGLQASRQEQVQDRWYDRLAGQPRVSRLLLRMAHRRS
jgi:class 3 adenylate cyclase